MLEEFANLAERTDSDAEKQVHIQNHDNMEDAISLNQKTELKES